MTIILIVGYLAVGVALASITRNPHGPRPSLAEWCAVILLWPILFLGMML